MTDFWASPQPGGQPQQPGWQQPPQPPQPGTSPWAVVALVTGILALVPLAIGAGTVALVQTAREGARGFGLAIAGLVAAAVWSLVAMAAAIGIVGVGLAGGFDTDPLGRVADAGAPRVGACLVSPVEDVSRYQPVPCTSRHDAEVYGVAPLAIGSDEWIGRTAVRHRSDDLCVGLFAPYVGESSTSSDYDYGFFAPDEREWRAGERRAVCVVLASYDGDLPVTVRSGEPA